jgi:urease accessory protein
VFERAVSGETFLKRQYAGFPFHMTRSLALDTAPAGMATVVLQSLGAGLLQGDRLAMAIAVGADASAHVASQGSTVAHAMVREGASLSARLHVAAGGWLEYLPRPTILFPDADVATSLEIDVEEGATVMWCDGYLAHDPREERGRFTRVAAETVLRDGTGRVLAIDRFDIGGTVLDDRGALDRLPVHAGFGMAGWGADDALAGNWRDTLERLGGVRAGVSALPNEAGLFCRLLAMDGIALRGAMLALWRATRLHVFRMEPGARP